MKWGGIFLGCCGLYVFVKIILYFGKSNVGDVYVYEVSGVYFIKDGLWIVGWYGECGFGMNYCS